MLKFAVSIQDESRHMDLNALRRIVSEQLLEHPTERTFSFEYEGHRLWVKRPEAGEANVWHTVLGILAALSGNRFLKPTVVTDPKSSLAHEGRKLRLLKENGISVPALLLQEDEYLVIEDAGTPLSVVFNSPNFTIEEKRQMAIDLSASLAKMHNKGFYHSRPALRDITFKEGKIFFMDFEENLENVLTDDEAILRDGFLYVHTLFRKLRTPALVDEALRAYRSSLDPILWEKMAEEAKRYGVLYRLLELFYRFLGKDGVAIYETLRYFRNL